MNDSNRFPKMVPLVMVMFASLCTEVRAASFSAVMAVDLEFGLSPGVAIAQGAPANLIPGCVSFTAGNAGAMCTPPTSTLGVSSLTFAAGPVSGFAGNPFGFSLADSFGTSITATITNTTAADILVPVGVGFSVDLEVTAAAGQNSDAAYGFSILGLGQGVTFGASKDLPCAACGADSYVNAGGSSFVLDVPANGFRNITIDPYASGTASVPEPASVALAMIGLFGVAWRNRRSIKCSRVAQALKF